ncbi:MAG: LD-carboxypeptidase [Roseivirga sp.]|nr:LD-carboxypeptidase [Roseivirga sp.]
MIIPEFLKKGDKVAVVNPAKRLQSDMTAGLEVLESWGLVPVIGKNAEKQHNLFAGTDEERLADVQWAIDHPEVKAVIMARGGYGTTRILDHLDFDKLLIRPKWICGFSDITSLLCCLDNLGLASMHSPMVASLYRDTRSDESLRKALMGESLTYEIKARKENKPGKAEGKLIGGNLTMICNSIGTSSEIETEGKILFLEEVGEYIYHLDRMLVQLRRADKLDNLRGVIIGDFSSMKDHNDTFGYSTIEVLESHFDKLGCPVVYGFPTGHESHNLTLVCGEEAVLEADPEKVTLSFR